MKIKEYLILCISLEQKSIKVEKIVIIKLAEVGNSSTSYLMLQNMNIYASRWQLWQLVTAEALIIKVVLGLHKHFLWEI